MKGVQKNLENKINKLREDNSDLKLEIAAKQREFSHNEKTIIALAKQLDQIKNPASVLISDHAIVRYLERIKGIDIQLIRQEILSDDLLKIINTLGGNGRYPDKDYKVVMKDNKIITILTDESQL